MSHVAKKNNENEKGLFEAFLGQERTRESNSFELRDDHPPRINFQKLRDNESLSVPYGLIGPIRYHETVIYLSVSGFTITIEGSLLKPLFDALHVQEVSAIIQQPESAWAFAEEADPGTVVRSIEWDEELAGS